MFSADQKDRRKRDNFEEISSSGFVFLSATLTKKPEDGFWRNFNYQRAKKWFYKVWK